MTSDSPDSGTPPDSFPAHKIDPPGFEVISSVLQALQIPLPAAEVHGLLCGLLCSRPGPGAKSRWFAELLEAAGLAPDALAEHRTELHALDAWHAHCQQALNDADLEFTLCLPADEVPLAQRLAALADFCAGFGYGIGIGLGATGNSRLPADSRELLGDFQSIESSDPVEAAQDNAAEQTLVELVEYVRMGVLLIQEELQPVPPVASSRMH